MGLFDSIANVLGNSPAPAAPAQETQASQGVDKPGLAEQWRSWINKPENSAALMQTGIALTQPLSAGQGFLGALSSSVGQGMEARDRVIQGERDQVKQQQDQQLAQEKFALDKTNSANDTSYRKQMGLAAMINASQRGSGVKTYKPENLDAAYRKFYENAATDIMSTYGKPTDPDFKTKVQAAWLEANQRPGAAPASVPAASPAAAAFQVAPELAPTAGSNPDPAPSGLQEQVSAARAKGLTKEQIQQAILADGINPNVLTSLNFD